MLFRSDQMSVGALRAISEAKRRVPDDIKVIGYDDVFIASVMETPLSTIHIRKRHMGIEAARLLLNRIQKPSELRAPRLIELESRLVVRKSTSATAPKTGSWWIGSITFFWFFRDMETISGGYERAHRAACAS